MSSKQESAIDSPVPRQPQRGISGTPHLQFGPSSSAVNHAGEIACWGVTEGAAGTISQVKGLAQAVGLPFAMHEIPLRSPWKHFWPGLVPIHSSIFEEPHRFDDATPKLVMTCGRQAVMTSLYFKRKLGKLVFTVHVQNPKIRLGKFDLVVIPDHDGVRGSNVIQTPGAIHHINQKVLDQAAATGPVGGLEKLKHPFALVLIGGPTKYYSFQDSDMLQFESNLEQIARQNDIRLAILSSRRTPPQIIHRLRQRFAKDHFVWDPQDENPYLSALALCSHIIVTCDSVSMISEASATGKPIFVEYLTERKTARRFRRFFHSFETAGITRPFEGQLAQWSYASLNNTDAVAQTIREQMQARGLL